MAEEPVAVSLVKRPFEVSVKLSAPTARRLAALLHQAQGAEAVARIAAQGAQAAIDEANRLAAAYQQAAYVVLESKSEHKLPDGEFAFDLDETEGRLRLAAKGPE